MNNDKGRKVNKEGRFYLLEFFTNRRAVTVCVIEELRKDLPFLNPPFRDRPL
ncbi:hypothetical protein HMPREF1002_04457 [Porphyromonas sp. 31_2]|nr:hypothetical protein HMPREF1002_04457 [Porphyromonas sp. 31_2]